MPCTLFFYPSLGSRASEGAACHSYCTSYFAVGNVESETTGPFGQHCLPLRLLVALQIPGECLSCHLLSENHSLESCQELNQGPSAGAMGLLLVAILLLLGMRAAEPQACGGRARAAVSGTAKGFAPGWLLF